MHYAILVDLERQKREHTEFATAVERLYGLLYLGLRDLMQVPGTFHGKM